MCIRDSAKALIVHGDKILLNRCVSRLGIYYALPGGGQRWGCIGTLVAILGLLFLAAFLLLLLAGGAVLAAV